MTITPTIFSLEECRELLDIILKKRRHRLTGSEYKAIIKAVDSHRSEADAAQLARQVVTLLARHEGRHSKPPFADPGMNRVFVEQCQWPTSGGDNAHVQELIQRREAPCARRKDKPRL